MPANGSNDRVGRGFESFEINDLKVVDQDSASWNHIVSWIRQVDGLRLAA